MAKSTKPERFFLDQDNSCHWYMIPEKHRADWEEFSSLDDDDEASWEVPHYAQRLPGHPSSVTFEMAEGYL